MAEKWAALSRVLRDISYAYRPLPLPLPDSFAGQTVCVVGSSTGLGLAAAKHCLNLGASEVIITCRDLARGGAAKSYLEDAATAVGAQGCVTLMTVDLNRYESVIKFANDLKKVGAGRGGIDFILLNAAVVQSEFVRSPEGWQEELQVNTLSTLLLAILLLPWLKDERKNRESPAHLAISSSTAAVLSDTTNWESWSQSGEGIFNHWNKIESWPGGLAGGYPVSKTLLMYGERELTKLAVGDDGR
jgi:NAD(P)-dependent dehydrogenase (short-subunit alcohol dehydrogenase family)